MICWLKPAMTRCACRLPACLAAPGPPNQREVSPPLCRCRRDLLAADELQAALAVLSLRAGQRALAPTVYAISRSPHHDLELRLRAAEALALLRDERAPALLALLDLFQKQESTDPVARSSQRSPGYVTDGRCQRWSADSITSWCSWK